MRARPNVRLLFSAWLCGRKDFVRILVLSDSHGDRDAVRRALLEQPGAEAVIFCGDGEHDLDAMGYSFPEKAFYLVRGNCDWGSQLELKGALTLEGVKLFFTHGHLYSAKLTDSQVIAAARGCGAQILLYGHTHIPRNEYQDGLYILNPGSCRGYQGTYGVVDLTKGGILTNIIHIKR